MMTLLQIVVDLIFALALILLIAAHFSHRSFRQEFNLFKATIEYWMEKLDAKVDGGKKPAKKAK